MMISRFISTFCLLFLSGCLFHGPEEEAPAPLRSAVRDSLLAADAARGDAATRQTLVTAAASWLDSGVVYLRAGAPILYGRSAALATAFAGAAERTAYEWRPLGGGVSRNGHDGYSYGIAMMATPNAEGAPSVRLDRYLAFWRRADGGSWRIVAYAEVGGAPPAGGAPALTPELPPTLALPRGRRSDALRQVRAADSAFALAADLQGTGVAFASFIAPQGVVFSGSEIVIGTEAVRA